MGGGVQGCSLMNHSCQGQTVADGVVGNVQLIISIRQHPEMATSSARWISERDSTEMSYGMHVWQCSMQLISNKLLGAQNVYNGLGQDRVDGDKLTHTPKCQGG